MADKLSVYKAKLRLLGADKFVKIILKNNKYILVSVDYKYPFNKFTVPNFIDILDDGCFSGTDLEFIRLGKNITSVGECCCANCPKLKLIEIYPSGINLIDSLKVSNSASIRVISTT